jgi:hypothetical protein
MSAAHDEANAHSIKTRKRKKLRAKLKNTLVTTTLSDDPEGGTKRFRSRSVESE